VDSLNQHDIASIGVDPEVAETPCDDHRCDSCVVCRRGACCRRDRADWRLPETGSWPGAVFGQLGVLARDARGAECHICGRVFRMLATHVWRTHQLWADEYRAYFGLGAKRGLAGYDTSAKLRAAAPSTWWHTTKRLWNSLALQLVANRYASAARGYAWRRGSTPRINKRSATAAGALLRSCATG
jgi:hypothetical protein